MEFPKPIKEKIEISDLNDFRKYLDEKDFKRRPIRNSKIKKYAQEYSEDNCFIQPISISENPDGGYYIIDGQHRILALKELMENKKISSAKIDIYNFGPLNKEQKIQLYNKLSLSIAQTTPDKLITNLQYSPIFSKLTSDLQQDIGVNLVSYAINSGTKQAIPFPIVVKAYYSIINEKGKILAYRNEPCIKNAKKWNEEDYRLIRNILQSFKEIHLNDISPNNDKTFLREHYITMFFYLYMKLKNLGVDRESWTSQWMQFPRGRYYTLLRILHDNSAKKHCIRGLHNYIISGKYGLNRLLKGDQKLKPFPKEYELTEDEEVDVETN